LFLQTGTSPTDLEVLQYFIKIKAGGASHAKEECISTPCCGVVTTKVTCHDHST